MQAKNVPKKVSLRAIACTSCASDDYRLWGATPQATSELVPGCSSPPCIFWTSSPASGRRSRPLTLRSPVPAGSTPPSSEVQAERILTVLDAILALAGHLMSLDHSIVSRQSSLPVSNPVGCKQRCHQHPTHRNTARRCVRRGRSTGGTPQTRSCPWPSCGSGHATCQCHHTCHLPHATHNYTVCESQIGK
jgi:hypothetical protein